MPQYNDAHDFFTNIQQFVCATFNRAKNGKHSVGLTGTRGDVTPQLAKSMTSVDMQSTYIGDCYFQPSFVPCPRAVTRNSNCNSLTCVARWRLALRISSFVFHDHATCTDHDHAKCFQAFRMGLLRRHTMLPTLIPSRRVERNRIDR